MAALCLLARQCAFFYLINQRQLKSGRGIKCQPGPGRVNARRGVRWAGRRVPSARITIEFDTYAMLDVPGAWQLLARGQRFPVAYLETSELFRRLQLNLEDLTWRQLVSTPVPPQAAQTVASYEVQPSATDGKGAGLAGAIAEAKRKLADSLGIASDKIEITIRL